MPRLRPVLLQRLAAHRTEGRYRSPASVLHYDIPRRVGCPTHMYLRVPSTRLRRHDVIYGAENAQTSCNGVQTGSRLNACITADDLPPLQAVGKAWRCIQIIKAGGRASSRVGDYRCIARRIILVESQCAANARRGAGIMCVARSPRRAAHARRRCARRARDRRLYARGALRDDPCGGPHRPRATSFQ